MTLFDVEAPPLRRATVRVPKGRQKPIWQKYSAKTRSRCSECERVSLEALPGPTPLIAQARFSRRQDGVTLLFCAAHANDQRDEDSKVDYSEEG
jgi:hypothetical protein